MYEARLGFNAEIGVGIEFNDEFMPLIDSFYITVNVYGLRKIKIRMNKNEVKQIRDALDRYIRESEV